MPTKYTTLCDDCQHAKIIHIAGYHYTGNSWPGLVPENITNILCRKTHRFVHVLKKQCPNYVSIQSKRIDEMI